MRFIYCVIVSSFSILSYVYSHSNYMITTYCSTSLSVGTVMMGFPAQSSTSRSVVVKRGTTALSSGANYVPGETLSLSISSTSGEYVIEVSPNAPFVASSKTGCSSNTRSITAGTITLPNGGGGTVTIFPSWATGQSTVFIGSSFVLNDPGVSVTSTGQYGFLGIPTKLMILLLIYLHGILY